MATEARERKICWSCRGRGVHIHEDPKPGKWFTKMRLTYIPGVEFAYREEVETRPESGEEWHAHNYFEVHYNGDVTHSGLSDPEELVEAYNERLKADVQTKSACTVCFGVGTIPKPLEQDEQIYDRGELMAEAFAAGGYQGLYDMQDEWSEYVGGRGRYADPVQKQIEADWNANYGGFDYD